MELRHIRYFVAVAEAEHFTRAAEGLHVSQPTLSHQIKQLEEELGAPLFDRIGKRIRLTPAGEVFREHARRILREVDSARAAIAEVEGLARGSLAVGAVQTVHAYLIPPTVARFSADNPAIGVQVRELAAGEIERQLSEGSLDVGVGFAPPAAAEIEAEPLFDEDLVLVVAEQHRLARRRRMRLAELDGERLVLLSPEFCTRRLVDESFREAGVAPRVPVEMNAIEGILEMVRGSGAATILPALALSNGNANGLRAVALSDPAPRRSVGLLWLRGAYRSTAARAFAATLKSSGMKQITEMSGMDRRTARGA